MLDEAGGHWQAGGRGSVDVPSVHQSNLSLVQGTADQSGTIFE